MSSVYSMFVRDQTGMGDEQGWFFLGGRTRPFAALRNGVEEGRGNPRAEGFMMVDGGGMGRRSGKRRTIGVPGCMGDRIPTPARITEWYEQRGYEQRGC